MTDLSFCYLHMTDDQLASLDFFDDEEFMADLGKDNIEVPEHLVPPDPDDGDNLPSQVHPSYPYGNPTRTSFPAYNAAPLGPITRSLYEDARFMEGSNNGHLRWGDIALDRLLPVDPRKVEADKAASARRAANGVGQGNNPSAQQPHQAEQQEMSDEEEEIEEEEDELEDNEENEGELSAIEDPFLEGGSDFEV
ncbi:hypothetical protein BOTBODRAFT_175888 [Botryobasidium botryosum FD-172 SS1]|uniref:Uncharacterized protein n=1 Tax=Botryobasidium botryosum (strain FD-172 SS1) TaxID=930990 RepID=A0A067MMA0_BOTB1|nr:hypothetical protein BOTBODRAFT_175888 [Botryobasidium botryosum FD-172 SS1]